MSSFHNNALVGASGLGGYQIERSLRFSSGSSKYLNRTPASTGNRRLWTWSGWVKRSGLGASTMYLFGASNTYFRFESDTFFANLRTDGGVTNYFVDFVNVFRDPSAWYHFVVAVDTAQATASNRYKVYVNNVQLTTNGSYSSYPPQNSDLNVNSSSYSHEIGRAPGVSSNYLDGYLTEVHFIDGQALTPSSFGETDTITGVWKPKRYTGTYGTNGFYLKFADNSGTTSTTLGKDSSGNGNNWTPNNFSVTAGADNDSLIDVPTPYSDGGNGRGNYCTLNPLKAHSGITLTNGNLNAVRASGSWVTSFATIGITSGKWYWEGTCTRSISDEALLGIAQAPATLSGYAGVDSYGWGYYTSATQSYKINNGSAVLYGATYTNGDVIGVALDLSAGTLTFYKNGTSQGTAYSSLSGEFFPTSSCVQGSAWVMNFGQRAFSYTPPSGFLALNTQNLPEPSIKKPNQYFDVNIWTGTSASNPRTNSGSMQPDLLWVKNRNGTNWPVLFDSARGVSKYLRSDSTGGDVTDAQYLTSFNTGGFTLGADLGGLTNYSGLTYVGWQWKESATPGFDIVLDTGTGVAKTVSHSLGVVPNFMIRKNRTSGTGHWYVYHSSVGAAQAGILQLTNAFASSTAWNSTTPTSSVFSVGANADENLNGGSFLTYLWSEVAGFSKFGSYTGNGSSDGPFVFTGMRPRWIMVKRSDSTANWTIRDTARRDYNSNILGLFPNLSAAEDSTAGRDVDMLSNGFKIRGTDTDLNASGGTYVFAAFSESAFKYSLAR